MARSLSSLSLLLATLLCATSALPAQARPAQDKAQTAAHSPAAMAAHALKTLFHDADEAQLARNPLEALYRGDKRYANRFGTPLSPDYLPALERDLRTQKAQLDAIDRALLSPGDQLAYDVFGYTLNQSLREFDQGLAILSRHLPLDHFNGAQNYFADLSSGQSVAPYKSVRDYEDGLGRLRGYVTFLQQAIEAFREGLQAGHVHSTVTTRIMIDQFQKALASPLEDSPFYAPIKALPADFSAADAARLTAAYRTMIETGIRPAYAQMHYFLEQEYLPQTRPQPGLISMTDGARYYQHLVRGHTTTDLTPDQIHQMGLEEVAAIQSKMDAVRQQVGFAGDLKAFFQHLRTDPQFRMASKADILAGYQEVWQRMRPAVEKVFTHTPKTPFEVRLVPDFLEANQAAAYYYPGSPDTTRPGVFYANGYDLSAQPRWGFETLFLHEAVPGHHFQISLAQENSALPNFMRFGGNTAYVEGWALYAESLGQELGFYTDPYQLYGHLDAQMMRAMRLVVDTGLHAKGWSREEAIRYMLDNSAMSERDCTVEVERYIAMPGQALAYMVGKKAIRAARTQAETALGERFNLRTFHDQILNTGALPLTILDAKINAWVATQTP